MLASFRKALAGAVALVALLAGIAGGAFGGGGATGTGHVAYGAISDFGSIFVNGIEFFTQRASITINGAANRSESDLKIGMVLTVYGVLDGSGTKGEANTVVYQADALGMVDRAPALGEFGVLGQAVSVDARTVYAGFIALDQLRVGDFVEVSGYRSPSGLLASRIERRASVPMVQLKGVISDVTATTFAIGSQLVDYAIATRKNVPAGGLQPGLTVLAKGPAPTNGRFVASSIEVVATSLGGSASGSLSGVIAGVDANAVTVNGQVITVSSATQYVNGNAADLAAGRVVKVDFAVFGNSLLAGRIEFSRLEAPAELEGDVTAVFADGFELLGPGGATITSRAATAWKDQSDARVATFGLADVRVGDHMEVRGQQVDVATVLAERVIRRRPSTAIVLQGRTLSVQAPSFTVIDITVTTDAATQFRDEHGVPIAPAAFFSKAAGHNVLVSAARRSDGALLATQVRID